MKFFASILIAAVSAATFATGAAAVPTYAAAGTGPGAHPMDCAKAKDKTRCEALNKDIEACRDKTDDAWRDCMRRPAPVAGFAPPKPRDCTKARNKARCEVHSTALEACKDRTTKGGHRRCMAEQLQASEKS